MKNVLFNESCFEPLFQNCLFHRNMCQEPLMRDLIETGLDISFEDPLSTVLSGKVRETLLNGICWRPFLTESVGVGIADDFCNGVESQQVQSLHRPILHARHHHSILPPLTNHLWNG